MFNFAAGPAMLPNEVLQKAQSDLLNWNTSGLSVLEMPFTSDVFKSIVTKAKENLKSLLNLPDNYHILFLQGGAYAHFSLLAMNLLGKNKQADYIQTGHWSTRAINEAMRYAQINIAASSEANHFSNIPPLHEWNLNQDSAFCHITSNETANGTQFHWKPDTGQIPLVADVTSDFLTCEIDISQYGMIYASAQKNLGSAGVTIIIIRDDLLDQAMDITPAVFNYGLQARNDSRVNTQPTFSIYITGLIFSWLKDKGGIPEAEHLNKLKAKRLYTLIDSDNFYHCNVAKNDRSRVNVCFKLPNESLETKFLSEAKQNGLINLKGHTATGGIRASLYNAMPLSGVDALINFMQDFVNKNT